MKKLCILFLLSFIPYWASAELKRVSPESQGVDSKEILAYYEAMMNLQKSEAHQIVILRHGNIIGEFAPQPFAVSNQHTLYSVSKTFVGIAVGLAIEDGKLQLEDKVIRFFPQLLPYSVSENLKALSIKHLLTMSSGIRPDWVMRNNHNDWIRYFLKKKIQTPGVDFKYDSMVSYLLSAIVQEVTGKKVIDLLNERIFLPLQIADAEWEESPEGYNTGGWGLRLSALSMAKFGQLLLNQGKWEGEQLVSAQWINEMTKKQIETEQKGAYGYQTWPCNYPNAYRADGAYGQYIIVAPNEDMVFAITQANVGNGVYERNLVWNLLKTVTDIPLKEGKAFEDLQQAEKRYMIPTEKCSIPTPVYSPLLGKTIQIDKNPMEWKSVRLNPDGEGLSISITTNTGETYNVKAGREHWESVQTSVCPPYTIKAVNRFKGLKNGFSVASCYGWEDENTLNIHILYSNWISGYQLKFKTNGDTISLAVKENTNKNSIMVKAYIEKK